MDKAEQISPEELARLQALHAELLIAQSALNGAMGMLGAVYKLPDGSQIDPKTGAIMRPAPKTEVE
jgi:hypothetical protein